jgi:hypothetical protein
MLFGVFFAILMVIVVIISSGMAICLLTYVMTATTVFYEMVTGHLRAAPPVMPQYQQTVYATPVAPVAPLRLLQVNVVVPLVVDAVTVGVPTELIFEPAAAVTLDT